MDYLIVSDAHGDIGILRELFTYYRSKVSAIFYAGDSELMANDPVFAGINTVRGNMDFDPAFKNEVVYHDEMTTIFMAHGHLFDTNYTLTNLLRAGRANHADVIVTGHTHQLGVEWFDNTLILNPGSISSPRGTYRDIGGTYAILSVTDTETKVVFYNRQRHAIPNLTFTWKNRENNAK